MSRLTRLEALADRLLAAVAPRAYGASLALGAIVGAALLAWAILPTCSLEGVVSGVVSPFRYRLSYYSNPISVDALDSLRIIAAPVVALSIYLLIAPIAAARLGPRVGSELALGGALSYIPLGVVPPLHTRLCLLVCNALDVDFKFTSNAGLVDLGSTELHTSLGRWAFAADMRAYLALAVLYAALASIGFFYTHGYIRVVER